MRRSGCTSPSLRSPDNSRTWRQSWDKNYLSAPITASGSLRPGCCWRKRAEDILDMVDKTTGEFRALEEEVGGDVHIGCAESDGIKYLAWCLRELRQSHPRIRYHLHSGNTEDIAGRLDSGLFDFAFLVESPNLSKYNYLEVPAADTWGVVMRKNDPLAQKDLIRIDDLIGLDLICSEQAMQVDIPRWCGEKADLLNLTGTVNLIYNGAVFVREGLGYLLSFDKLADTSAESELTFRPLEPTLGDQNVSGLEKVPGLFPRGGGAAGGDEGAVWKDVMLKSILC